MVLSIKGRVQAFQIGIALGMAILATLAFVELHASNYFLDRAKWARRQLAAISQLAISANRYSEQIAELLLLGEPEREDFDSARAEVSLALISLREAIILESAGLSSEDERRNEEIETARINRMQALIRDIDRAVERLLLLHRQGRQPDAISLFRSQIENRLDAEFERLIREALVDEQTEARRIELDLGLITLRLTIATLLAAAVLLLAVLVAGILFSRSILRPIKALNEGARHIEAGVFDRPIQTHGRDELAVLSRQFNAMAAQLSYQRDTIAAARDDLGRQVVERTQELADANKRLTLVDRQRLRFLADVSHELRTPITAIRGEAEVALRGASKGEAIYRDALTTVVARASELTKLVEDLLFLARSEGEEVLFDFHRVRLDKVLLAVAQESRTLGYERNIRVEPTTIATGLHVRADARRLKQLLLILLDNAIKYSEPHSVVEVSLTADGSAAVVGLRDRGIGIPADDLAHVFERFFRGSNVGEAGAIGSGLGLPVAQWIAERHRATIEIKSVLTQGTEVFLRLPLQGTAS